MGMERWYRMNMPTNLNSRWESITIIIISKVSHRLTLSDNLIIKESITNLHLHQWQTLGSFTITSRGNQCNGLNCLEALHQSSNCLRTFKRKSWESCVENETDNKFSEWMSSIRTIHSLIDYLDDINGISYFI